MCQTVKYLQHDVQQPFHFLSDFLLAYGISSSRSLTDIFWGTFGLYWVFLPLKDGDDGSDYAQGPDSLHSLFHWPTFVLDKLFGTGHEVPQEGLTHLQNLHVILTTEFSGMGTVELAAELLIRSIQERCQIGGWLVHQTMTRGFWLWLWGICFGCTQSIADHPIALSTTSLEW